MLAPEPDTSMPLTLIASPILASRCAHHTLHAVRVLPQQPAIHTLSSLSRRLVLSQESGHSGGGRPAFYPQKLPRALAAMPALLELELHGVGCMSEALTHELSIAPQPSFTGLTSLTLADDEVAVFTGPAPALCSWLRWVLPAATQLRKLCVSSNHSAGDRLPNYFARICALHVTSAPLPSGSVPLLQVCFHAQLRLNHDPYDLGNMGHSRVQALTRCSCTADWDSEDSADGLELRRPELVVPCPPGLEELHLVNIPCMWEDTPRSHTGSLRELHLCGDDHLGVSRLAIMTALQRLHAITPDVRAAVTGALPALTRLTGLDLTAGMDSYPGPAVFTGSAACTNRLALLLRQLSALPSLQHLSVGGRAFTGDQLFDGQVVFPMLEVLHLKYYIVIEANNNLLAFLDQPSRLSAVYIREVRAGLDHETVSDFRSAMRMRIPAYVSVTVCCWYERMRSSQGRPSNTL